jgi:hypothetical protein
MSRTAGDRGCPRGTLAALGFALAIWVGATAPAAERRPPNVVLFLMDDMGWRDVGFMGNGFVASPRLDRLAARGVVFTQAYQPVAKVHPWPLATRKTALFTGAALPAPHP